MLRPIRRRPRRVEPHLSSQVVEPQRELRIGVRYVITICCHNDLLLSYGDSDKYFPHLRVSSPPGRAGKFTDGAGKFTDGAGKFTDGAGKFTDGAGKFTDGAGKFTDGASKFTDGASKFTDGAGKLTDGAGGPSSRESLGRKAFQAPPKAARKPKK
ncbi:MAG: hypothetical protein LBS82_05620, partial [Spirochaetaceae bacterium]|nr:hypothetical protein [Spirochaetaceae bacterium]